MTSATGRAHEIVSFMERIAPSEVGAAVVTHSPSSGNVMILWNLLPPDILPLRLSIASVAEGFVAMTIFQSSGADDDPVYGEPELIAAFIHTDDEVARKTIVFGLQVLDDFREHALRSQELELAQIARHYRDLLHEGLSAWGAGNSAQFSRASPRMASQSQRVIPPGAHPRATGDERTAERMRLKQMRDHAWVWIWVNAAMIAVALVASLMTYQQAVNADEGTYYLWWGPVVWGLVNLVRFGSRLSKIGRLNRQLSS